MGYYINPTNDTKEDWLLRHGRQISFADARLFKSGGSTDLVVCLVDNGWMTAAGIAYDDRERDAFAHNDGRPKKWYLVSRADLKPWYSC